MKSKKENTIKDVTKEWKKNAKPKSGIITISDFTITNNGERYNDRTAKLSEVLKKI